MKKRVARRNCSKPLWLSILVGILAVYAAYYKWEYILGTSVHRLDDEEINLLKKALLEQINLTTVELDDTVLNLALEHFQLKENPNNRVIIKDGIDFLQQAEKKGAYKAIFIDTCYSDLRPLWCPVEGFLESGTIEKIAHALDDEGVLSVNFVTISKKWKEVKEYLIEPFQKHFKSCFFVQIVQPAHSIAEQQVHTCTIY
ncbi:unnamed protein product [Strongylus vulgaris]|uniref:Uncharacterized protein n=1 Tax=Strongylus vulgaris TaxID=40348 RepID=A0A3P7JMI8_STRVU|nr:unnamed protein product [Strongylus vulgaris]